MSDSTAQRFVPGAPPPPAPTKSQLKKRRKTKGKSNEPTSESPVEIADSTSAALVEKAPDLAAVQEGSVAPELVVQSESQNSLDDADLVKSSPIVELITKRLKATNKKITRITTYTTAAPESLNEDQKRAITTLPALEATSKELGEVKKVIEAHESDLAHELALKRREIEAIEKQKVSEAISAAQASNTRKTSAVLSFIRLRTLISSGEIDISSYGVSQEEADTILAAADLLLGREEEIKNTLISGFLSGEGEYETVPYTRLLEIAQVVIAPRPPTPEAEEAPQEVLQESITSDDAQAEFPVTESVQMTTTGSFHFMQASELETPSFDENTEWVESSDPAEHQEQPSANGNTPEATPTPPDAIPTASPVEPIDWAAEGEDELPSIDGLHATFGKSGSATPVVQEPVQDAQPTINGRVAAAPEGDEEGFTQARGGRARGRGFRGGDRPFRSFRGGDRGGFRAERGGFRGSHRGGDRGDRGSGSRGRGEWRSDGEHRGRGGRGRGRGGDRSGSFAAPTPA